MFSQNAATLLTSASLLYLGQFAAAHPSPTPDDSGVSCTKFIIPVTINASNFAWNDGLMVNSNVDAANYAWDSDTWSHPMGEELVAGPQIIQETFNIGAQLCVPSGEGSGKSLQIATHGVGYDKRYWDVEPKREDFSYVLAAVKAGFSILTYDRLGVGFSDKPDAYNVVQYNAQVEILKELTTLARNGGLAKASKADFPVPSFDKVGHVGHSYGSSITEGLLIRYPELSDAAIKTGFIVASVPRVFSSGAFGWQYAPENDPAKFGDRGSGYVVQGTKNSVQQLFFSSTGGAFDPEMLDYAFDIRQPASVGELRSGFAGVAPATGWTGPVQFFLAEFDYGLCSGDCKNAYNETLIKTMLYPSASSIEYYIQPGNGHGLTLHKNATAGYAVMFDFFTRHGL